MKNYPLKSIALLFSGGILLGHLFAFDPLTLLILSFLLLVFLFAALLNGRFRKRKLWLNAGIYLLILLLSSAGYTLARISIRPYPFDLQKINDAMLSGSIESIELKRDYEIRFYLRADSVAIKGRSFPLSHNFLCRLRESNKSRLDSTYNLLFPGNYIKATGVVSEARRRRNPGEFDYQAYQEQRGTSALFTMYYASDMKFMGTARSFPASQIFSLRKSIDEAIMRLHNEEAGALLRGILLADRSSIDEDVQEDFTNTGVVHILAVSGSNVAFLLLILSLLTGRMSLKIRLILMILGICFFLAVTGLSPSVLRAALMSAAVIMAWYSGRSRDVLNALSLSALIMLAINPLDLFDPGFQLSFVTVISIVLLTPPILNFLKNLFPGNAFIHKMLLIVSVTLAAQAGTLPFILYYFSKLSIVSLPANLLVIPLIGVISGGGITAIILSGFFTWGAEVFAGANNLITGLCFDITSFLGNPEFSFLQINRFTVFDGLAVYFTIFLLYLSYHIARSRKARVTAVILSLINLLLIMTIDNKDLLPDGKLNIIFTDVGQGDAALLKFPDGSTMLLDAGQGNRFTDCGKQVIIPLLDRLGISQIDLGIVSHIDNDHYGGFISLIGQKRIKRIIKTPPDYTDRVNAARDIKFELFMRLHGIPFIYFDNQRLKLSGAVMYILSGNENGGALTSGNNDRSGIVKIVYGSCSFLFTGDAGMKAEDRLCVNYPEMLKSDVLKAAHHGSHLSTGERFLGNVRPEIAVISSGYLNRFGHPSPIVLERLGKVNTRVYRTDISGAIILSCDGKNIRLIDWREK